MRNVRIILTKSQSITEYLIVLAAIMVGIIASTIGLRTGLQHSLDLNQNISEGNIQGTDPAKNVKNETYYSAARERSDSAWSSTVDQKNISPAFQADQYYFHEGNSDMSYVSSDGTVLDSENSFTATGAAGASWNPGG